MNDTAKLFYDIDEPFAAGFFEDENGSVAARFCRAYRRLFENYPMPEYRRENPYYPYGELHNSDWAVLPTYYLQYYVREKKLKGKSPEAAEIFSQFDREHGNFLDADGCKEVLRYASHIDGWNHSALNYKRILAEGIDRYEERVSTMADEDLRNALLDVILGIRCFHRRAVEYLESVNAEQRLISALKKVPFSPADTAYEALVAVNFMLCLDGGDNLGYVDGWFPRYWKGEDLSQEIRYLLKNAEYSGCWSLTIGPEYGGHTVMWLEAAKGMARPMIELRTSKDMPKEIWDAAVKSIFDGNSNPSFYNEEAIQSRLAERFPDAPREDIYQFAGMGCTETSLSGMTLAGGIDQNLNVLKVFDEIMREKLSECSSFDEFYRTFTKRLRMAQDNLVRYVNAFYKKRASSYFAPIRTLFTDDCIDSGKGFFQGGARYTYSIPSDSGIPNTVDSLLAVEDLVFSRKLYTPEEFITALDNGAPELLSALRGCPSYGVGDEHADALAHDLTKGFYGYYREAKLDIGDGFLPTCHQFVRHIDEGLRIGNTPDGRKAGTPVADSIGAVNGKAVLGPTAMMKSAAAFDQSMVYSIPVLNLSITEKYDPAVLRSLIEGYFDMGGTQVQITCADRETLLKAKESPEDYRDLIVRVGGFSDYFYCLSDELKDAVIARTLF